MCAGFVTSHELCNYLLFQPHPLRLPPREGEISAFGSLRETREKVGRRGEAPEKTCLCLKYLADSLSFIGRWTSSRNAVLQRACGVVLALWWTGYSFPATGYGRVQPQGDHCVQNGGEKSEMVSVWPAAIFSKCKWPQGSAPAPHNTGRLCLIPGVWSSSVSLWFVRSALTAPAQLELQAAIVLVIGMLHSLMCFQVLCPVNPVGKKTILHPST